jgi:PKD repeat protein
MPEPDYILSTDDFLVISGRNGDGVIVIEYSSDLGTTWTSDVVGYVDGVPASYITYGNGIFLGLAGAVRRIIGTPSGTTIDWSLTPVTSPLVFINAGVGLLFDGTYFVAYGAPQGTDPALLYSSDGQNWSVGGAAVGGSSASAIAMAYVDGIYVLSFINGVWYTNNLTSPMIYAASEILDFIAAGNGRFVALGRDGNIYISTNGATWTNTGPPPIGVNGITFNQDRFIISSVFSDSLAISPDGITWTLTISPHLLPSSNTVPGMPQWIGYDLVSGNSQGNYIALFKARTGLDIPQAVATIGVCPCGVPTTGDYWARFVNVRMRGVSVKRIGTAPPPAPPIADFSATPLNGTAPLTVNFTDTSTNSPTSWQWDFTNNGSVDSTLQNPTYTYNDSGTYTVKLIATNAGGSDTEIKSNYITVSDPPSPIHDLPIQLFGSLTVFYTETTQTLPVNLFGSLTVFYTETTQTLPVNLFGSDGDNLFYTPNTQTLPINLSS